MNEVVIVSGMRTPVGDFLGSLKDLNSVELGALALKRAMEEANVDPGLIEEVVCGNPDMAGAKSNPGRQVAIYAGCTWETVACTVNQQCVSSLRAAEIMYQEILLGKVDIGAAVGCASMSNIPYLLIGSRTGYKMGHQQLVDGMYNDGMTDAFYNILMGVTAENIAEMYKISREEQDEFALMSHHRACASINNKTQASELIPVEIKSKKGSTFFDHDEHPRQGLTMEDLARLKPVFVKDGTVTAGNSSGINDGAAALVMMSLDKAKELGIKPLARIVATGSAAVDAKIMGMGVVPSVRKALKFADLPIEAIDYWEINEAFAAQIIGCNRELKIPLDKMNANGGGISIGHPVGMTGARLLVSLVHEMGRRSVRYGAASLCGGGGPSTSMIIERYAD
ncbi:MAG: Acetyl-CoA acetyltransferase [Syntrophorhabdus sp. PtaU1.Bin058]|nr:MAG: Acetyl-CoA acetyltransferase [Syntrophorhabdus sp. PtaU1.Bin058]